MRKGSRVVFIAAFVVGAVIGHCARSAFAVEWVTGNQLVISLKSEIDREKHLALGYIMGVHDAQETVTSCTPPGVTAVQVAAMVIKYSETNPQDMHHSADRVISHILAATFPCEEKADEADMVY